MSEISPFGITNQIVMPFLTHIAHQGADFKNSLKTV